MWCGQMYDRAAVPFVFAENTIIDNTYLDMIELYVFPQILCHQLDEIVKEKLNKW